MSDGVMTRTEKPFYECYVNEKYYYIPARMGDGIRRYLDDHCETGSFLATVFLNDLVGAIGAADPENADNILAYASFLHNKVDTMAWGSKEKVEAWLNAGSIPAGGSEDVDT